MTNHPDYNFLGLPQKLSTYETARAVILPVPYELTLSYLGGARSGPHAIIAASRQVETYDNDLGRDPSEIGIATLPELEQVVAGPSAMQDIIYDSCLKLLNEGKFVMSLGGEHSITAALVKAHKAVFDDLSVVQIDAHTDLRNSYQGSKYSHACVMARVAEMANFVSVGIRSFCGNDNEKKVGPDIISPLMFRRDPDIFKKRVARLGRNVYITFDLDGFDPSVMPAVGTPEPGGLSWDEAMAIIGTIAENKKIVGADVVELSPRPGLTYADFTAAKLVYKIIAASFFGR